MQRDGFNNATHEKIMITHATVSLSYRASLKIDWVSEGSQPEVDLVSSLSNESQDEDEEFFDGEAPEDNRAFINMVWQGMKRHIN